MNWKSWKYKNLTTLLFFIVLSFALGSFLPYKNFVLNLGLFAALASGIIFISTFTAPLSAVTLLILAHHYPLYIIWITAGISAVISDFLFFNLTKDGIAKEIGPIYDSLGQNHFKKILNTRHFRWFFPVIGALIILSPLPKTPGIHLLGITRLKKKEFILMSACLNIIGIAFILLLSFVVKI